LTILKKRKPWPQVFIIGLQFHHVKIQHESWSKLLSCTKENITPQASLLGFVVTRPVSAVHGKKIEHTFIWDSKYEQSMDSNRLQMMTLEARCTKTKGKKPRRKTVRSGD
jgi:hypothetical protein